MNTNGQNTSDTQRIPPIHLTSSPFLTPADMDATIEVKTPPIGTRQPSESHERVVPLPPQPDPTPQPTPFVAPAEYIPEPYSTQPLPCSYPMLWHAHCDECRHLRVVLCAMFSVIVLAIAASYSLMIFVASGIVLCIAFLLMLLLRKEVP